MELHPVEILYNIINITVLFILLRLILWKPMSKFLSERAQRVEKELSDAEKTRAEAEALKLEYSKNLENIESEGRELMRESQMKATADAAEIVSDAKAKADQILREAHERIAEEKERAVAGARNEVVQLATDMASRVLKREVSLDDSMIAADEFFREER